MNIMNILQKIKNYFFAEDYEKTNVRNYINSKLPQNIKIKGLYVVGYTFYTLVLTDEKTDACSGFDIENENEVDECIELCIRILERKK